MKFTFDQIRAIAQQAEETIKQSNSQLEWSEKYREDSFQRRLQELEDAGESTEVDIDRLRQEYYKDDYRTEEIENFKRQISVWTDILNNIKNATY